MKDKLRELAVKIIHDGESLPMLEISKGIYRLQKFNDGKWTSLDDDELLAILDAEGDGGVVAWQIFAGGMRAEWEHISKEQYEKSIATGRYLGLFSGTKDFQVRVLYTHPARSCVVSDEDVKTTCRKYYNCGHPVYPPVFEAMRAALESYERNRK